MKKLYMLMAVFTFSGWAIGQVTANEPDPIILCDVNNPGDQMEVFDLTIREAQIIGGQSNVVVTYHLTSGDALGNGGFIEMPESFTNTSDPQTIFIRVENVNNSNDWEITVMQLIVPFIPEIVTPAEDIVMDDANGDGFEIFDLTRDEADVLGGQDPFEFTITYYETQADADANINPIANPENYTNTTTPQTIYTRFAPLQDQCQYESYNFEIIAENVLATEELIADAFNVFPNPVSDQLFITSSQLAAEVRWELRTINGRLLMSERLEGKMSTKLNVEALPTGMYFVRISSEGAGKTFKLIKK